MYNRARRSEDYRGEWFARAGGAPQVALCGATSRSAAGPVRAMAAALVGTLFLGPIACDRGADNAAAEAPESVAAKSAVRDANGAPAPNNDIDQTEIDQLLSLPYAGWVEDEEDEDTDVGLIQCDRQRSYPGYTLVTVFECGKAALIDHQGRIVHTWQAEDAMCWNRTELLPDGDIVAVGADSLTAGADGAQPDQDPDWQWYALRMNWNGETEWKKRLRAHHHIRPTPDGRLLVLTWARRDLPAMNTTVPVRDNEIVVLSADGEVVDSLSLYDAVSAKPKLFPLIKRPPQLMYKPRDWADGQQPWVDLFHSNSVEWMYHEHLFDKDPIYGPDNVLLCSRNQSRIAIFDMKKKELLWAWGLNQLSGPHDAQILENGNVLLFDNGVGRGWSRVIELNPLTERVVWEYKASTPSDFYSRDRGSAQRLPNGNTLITNAAHGEVFEVTPEGDVVWRYLFPEENAEGKRATINHAKRFEPDFIDGLMAQFGTGAAQPESSP